MLGSYDIRLVILSVVVAIMASYTALDMSGRVAQAASREAARRWLIGGAFAMGTGIWSMHFVGMLAFKLPIAMAYDPWITLVSLAFAILISGLALWLVSRGSMGWRSIVGGGLAMGVGICAMHYTGMAAMRMQPAIDYDPLLFSASVLIAVTAAMVALWLCFALRKVDSVVVLYYRFGAAAVMGCAIAGMHYTGMAAANFAPGAICGASARFALDTQWLGVGIAVIMVQLMVGTIVASAVQTRRASELARLMVSVEASNRNLTGEIEERKKLADGLEHANRELSVARSAAEEASRAKAAFLASMSHEIRTPMNAIIGMTSILLDTSLSSEQKECAEVIRNSGEHLLGLINDILDYSKIEAGKLELEQQPFSLRDCVESSLDLVMGTAEAKGVEIGYLMLPGTPEGLLGDAGRLRQVLVNLLSNAVKFTPERGQVMVEVGQRFANAERCEIEFSVKDTGIGIAREVQERLFQPFTQADASTTRTHGGTGLGLSICRRLVELMGGNIGVNSSPGQGSTFHFVIPARTAALQQQSRRTNVAPALKGLRVLVVDDIEINRRILGHYARLWGMQPHETASAQEALSWVARGDPFDLAMLDYHMPGMDGLTLARELRKHCDAKRLPIVMLSSMSLNPRAEGLEAWSMLKPIKPSRLLDVVSQLLVETGHTEPAETTTAALPHDLGIKHPLRILVAEDNAVNQKVAQLLLERMGYKPDFAANGIEALAAVERQIYDVVFMDVQMPEMDGLAATREMCRRHPSAARPRIVAMTANASAEDRKLCELAGMDDYVSKPVTPDRLAAALRRAPRREALPDVEDFSKTGLAELRRIYEADGAIEIIGALAADLPRQHADVLSSKATRNPATLARVAHTLKAGSRMVGASALGNFCEQLERLAMDAKLEQALTLMPEMLQRYERLVQRLQREVAPEAAVTPGRG